MKELVKKLAKIQKELKAPKSQFNKFGGYKYRNQEDILEAVKPLLDGLVLTVNDEIIMTVSSSRVYVKSTVTITDGVDSISNSAYAREAETQKGMNEAQITGSASSYARKYALNGLFLIDDTKDADATETHGKEVKSSEVESSKEVASSTSSSQEVKKQLEPMVVSKPSTSKWGKPKTKPENGDLY